MIPLQKRILVAGTTGYLGSFMVKELSDQGYYIRALVREKQKSNPVLSYVDEVLIGDVTKPETLKGICAGIDFVFSSVGITSLKGMKTIHAVDYQGNLYLLREAEKSHVRTFMYIHVLFDSHLQEQSFLVKRKEKFVQALIESPISHIVIKPTGFYSDMSTFYKMAKKGRVFLLGSGNRKINPIHGSDLAKFCVSALEEKNQILEVGGPETFTYQEIGNLALETMRKPKKIIKVPFGLMNALIRLLRVIYPIAYPMAQFLTLALNQDLIAPAYGERTLKKYYHELIENNK